MGKASRKKYIQRKMKPFEGVKLSDALVELCEPFKSEEEGWAVMPIEEFEQLVSMAVIAWNISHHPQEEQDGILNQMEEIFSTSSKEIDKQAAANMVKILEIMVERKNALHPNDNRVVGEFLVTEKHNAPHLMVSFTIPE